MRIDRLDLVAFGHFSDVSLGLTGNGLNVVYGANEAGKTTVRAAVMRLLFGFPHSDPYGYLHPQSTLQIGARLVGTDGQIREVVRHKRRIGPLVDRSDDTALTDDRLVAVFGDLQEPEFTAMFTLGSEELRQGTEDLLASGGALGETLFAAGFGRSVGPVLQNLEQEAAELYRPRGQNQTVNAALRRHDNARREAKDRSVRPSHYDELRRNDERAKRQLDDLRKQRRSLTQQRNQLATLHAVVPQLRLRQQAETDRRALVAQGSPPPVAWADSMAATLAEQADLLQEQGHLTATHDAVKKRLDHISVDGKMLELAAAIDEVNTAIGAYEEGQRDRSGLQLGVGETEAVALAILGELLGTPAPPVSAIDAARPVLSMLDKIGQARDRWSTCQQDRRTAEQAVAEAEEEAERLRARLAGAPPLPDTKSLQGAVADALRLGDGDGALAAARQDRQEAADAVTEMAVALHLDPHAVAEAVARPAPSSQEADALLQVVERFQTDANAAERRATELEDIRRQHEAALVELARGGDLPTEADLAVIRHQRDELWAAARAAWLSHRAVTGPGTDYPDEPDLADAVTRSIDHADRTVDRLWREADRTAHRASLSSQLQRAVAERDEALRHADLARTNAADHYHQWRRQWPDQLLPDRHEELRRWIQDFEALCARHQRWRHADRTHRVAFRAVVSHRRTLGRLLADDEIPLPAGAELRPMVERAEQVLQSVSQARAEQAVDQQRLAEVDRVVLPKRRREATKAAEAEDVARGEVLGLLGGFAPAAGSAEEAGAAVERLRVVDRWIHERDLKASRIQGIDTRTSRFEAQVAELVAAAPDLADQPAGRAARTLAERLRLATQAAAARDEALAHLHQARQALDAVHSQLAGLLRKRAELAAVYGLPDDPEQLAAAVDRSRSLATLDRTIAETTEKILAQGAGRGVDELEAEAGDRDLAALAGTIGELDEQMADLDEAITVATDDYTAAAAQLRSVTGSDESAAFAQEAEEALDIAQRGADRYARLLLARYIADMAIAHYRRAHESPLLAQTSAYLSQLTEGRYLRAAADTDTSTPRLLAVRADGQELGVDQLSEGTRDQLYLALRLAAVAESVTRRYPVPILLDDVLVTFDDLRLDAALRCLADVGQRTQVVLFTHHHHVVDHARRVLGHQATICSLPDSDLGAQPRLGAGAPSIGIGR